MFRRRTAVANGPRCVTSYKSATASPQAQDARVARGWRHREYGAAQAAPKRRRRSLV